MLYALSVQRKGERNLALMMGVALLAFILAVGALDRFQPSPGLRIRTEFADRVDEAFQTMDRSETNPQTTELYSWIVSIVIGLSIILFIIGVIRKESRLSTLVLIPLAAIVLALFGLANLAPRPSEDQLLLGTAEEESAPPSAPGGAMDEEDAVQVEQERPSGVHPFSWIVTGIALIGLFFVVRPRLRLRSRERTTEEELGGLAERAAAEARSGDVLEVVVRCYREMMQVSQQWRSVHRRKSTTPREFAAELVAIGVPAAHIDGLTSLFERVRYGRVVLTSDEEREAVAHLNAIAAVLRTSNA
jgi:hypothetical protein